MLNGTLAVCWKIISETFNLGLRTRGEAALRWIAMVIPIRVCPGNANIHGKETRTTSRENGAGRKGKENNYFENTRCCLLSSLLLREVNYCWQISHVINNLPLIFSGWQGWFSHVFISELFRNISTGVYLKKYLHTHYKRRVVYNFPKYYKLF